jgi:hypothetical protein
MPVHKKKKSTGAFSDKSKDKYRFDQAVDIFSRCMGKSFLHCHSLPEGYYLAEKLKQNNRNGHNPEASELNQEQDYQLAVK